MTQYTLKYHDYLITVTVDESGRITYTDSRLNQRRD